MTQQKTAGRSSASRTALLRLAPLCAPALALVLFTGTVQPAWAQPATDTTRLATNTDLLADFVHYVRIENVELASAKGSELMARGLTGSEFVSLVEASGDIARFEETLQRAVRVQALEPLAAAMTLAYEGGKLERARNPEEIARNIELLTSTDRGRRIGEERLMYAGEYAMPQLLEAFFDRSSPTKQVAAQRVIIGLGQQAVVPLCVAMMRVSPAQQEQIANALGSIPHRTSLPFLADLAASTASEPVRAACRRSIEKIGGAGDNDAPALYRILAEIYYAQRTDVTSFPGEEHQLLWSYEPGAGLVMTAIRTPVYHEAMAMRLLERGMRLELSSGGVGNETLALWVASNFRRQIDTPDGYDNPAYITAGANARRAAMYYAVAAGSDVTQRVLARALSERDTQLARLALAAVQTTAGVRTLVADSEGTSPLVRALSYPNRRVQYEAALAIALANPTSAFSGSDRVVPILASAITGASTRIAAVVAPEAEAYQSVRATLERMGYTVLPQARAWNDLTAELAEAAGIDLVVSIGVHGDRIPALISDVRGTGKTLATPLLVLTNQQSYTETRRRYASDSSLAIRQSAIGDAAIAQSITQLVEVAAGGVITGEEADAYAAASLAALRDLAVSGNQTLNVSDASLPLISALSEVHGEMRLLVAEVLSRVNQTRAQRALLDAAMAAVGDERVSLLDMVSESGKRFGSMLDQRQVAAVVTLAQNGSDDEATAAAGLIGALNLAGTELVPLILGAQKD
ncbi:MAG: HEAT repeat domain-containing protein [Phycisphaeraceae bacterium]|nr:HEAT repeat domain-containing protein [Phycisphaeraceae bacterium]